MKRRGRKKDRARWRSTLTYEHPGVEGKNRGRLILSKNNIYYIRIGGESYPVSQSWAQKIHEKDYLTVPLGRPRVGPEILPALTVSKGMREKIETKGRSIGLSLPNARREAYRIFLAKKY